VSNAPNTAAPGALAVFLRSRRERTSPRDVGLPDSGRRRTPGLRREEVATLAGVSVDYLIRLEQGRDIHPSADVLSALADAMRLNEEERRHLLHLGMKSGKDAICPSLDMRPADLPPTITAVLDALDPTPAFVLGPIGDIVAWNSAWGTVAEGLGMLDEIVGSPPNLARFVFLHPAARSVYPQWRAAADEQVARLRRSAACLAHDSGINTLIDELRAHPEFELRWDAHPIGEKRRGAKVLTHPDVGDLNLDFEVLDVADDTGLQLVTWLAGDAVTAARLRSLVLGPHLRLVEGE
jgi:transcriptional regulator with XRE-family HTH domain